METESSEGASRWERRKERTRHRLLTAAEQLFRTQSFDETTVEEIAEAADVAKGTFFNYFESKDSLLGELLYHRMQALLTSPPGQGAPAHERIRLLLQALWEELVPYRHLSRRIFAYTIAHPPSGILSRDQPFPARTLANLIREGQAQGIFRADVSADIAGGLLATFFFRLCVLEYIADEDAPFCWRDQVQEALDLLYHGLMVKAPIDSGGMDSGETTQP